MPATVDSDASRSLTAADWLALLALVALYAVAGLDLLSPGTVAVNMLFVVGLHQVFS